MKSVNIIKVVSSNSVHGEVY